MNRRPLDREQHYTRRDLAEMRGFDPHPDDMAPSAQWVQDQQGGELLDALTRSVEQARQLARERNER